MTSDEPTAAPVDHPALEPADADLGAPRPEAADDAGTTSSGGAFGATSSGDATATEPTSEPTTEPTPLPDEATLAQIAEPAQLRRAPRIGSFITTGVLVGAVVGWLLAVLGTGTSGEARTGAILLTAAGLAALGAIVGSGLAALADRRSVRRRPGSRPGR